jgi:hypothetical protein
LLNLSESPLKSIFGSKDPLWVFSELLGQQMGIKVAVTAGFLDCTSNTSASKASWDMWGIPETGGKAAD